MNSRKVLTKKLLFPILLFTILFPAAVFAGGNVQFKDVPANGIYAPYITFLYERGVIKGYPDGTFGPGRSLTRAEAVTALSLASNISPQEAVSPIFSDVAADHWAAGFISAGVKSGILKGYPDGTFRPENMVTRAELAALLVNLSGMETSQVTGTVTDVSPEHWAKVFIDSAVKKNFFLYSPGTGSFNPESPASREVFARGTALAVTSSPKPSALNLAGRVTPVRGQARIIKAGNEMDLTASAAIVPGDIIRTGSGGEAEITFDDGTGLLIMPNTSVTISKMMGRLAIRSDGRPVTLAVELEVTLDSGKIMGATSYRPGQEAKNTTAYNNGPVRIASTEILPLIAAAEAGEEQSGGVTVSVVMPWGTVKAKGFWINEVTPTGQSTNVLMGQASVSANGSDVTVNSGQASTIASSGSKPEPPRRMTAAETSVWNNTRQWVESQAGRIDQLSLIDPGSTNQSPQADNIQQPQGGLQETVSKSITAISQNNQGNVMTTPLAGGGGGGGAVTQPQIQTPGIVYSMDYSLRDVTPTDRIDEVDGYQVDIYLESLANATYIEYTFEYDNTRLTSTDLNLDLEGIITVFAGYNLSLSDLANDSGWVTSGTKTYRTIRSEQLSDPINYSGGRARLLYMDFKRINPGSGDATVKIKNIKVSNGSTNVNAPEVTITLPDL
ncbi:MAG: S-layer homology domain-containing protein [Bacillota bacterium]